MKLSSLHILLTYQCNYECDHCFVWGSPSQSGVFTLSQLEEVFQQALLVPAIREFYFEGGETFIYYPILVKAVRRAYVLGFKTGIVSNGYWATTVDDALTWLRPLAEAGLDRIEVSYDAFHGSLDDPFETHPALLAARQLGLILDNVSLNPPQNGRNPDASEPGEPVAGGDVMFRGRAAVMLTEGLPTRPWNSFTECPFEDLTDPGRVHVDPFGNVHLCQGVVMGNVWERPLAQIIAEYNPVTHPIAGPLLHGGPAELVHRYHLPHQDGCVDACHLCYSARETLRVEFPQILAPDQMYGVGLGS